MSFRSEPTKYGNRKVVIDGISFDSQREANRWCELLLLLRAGAIRNLRRQVGFELIPAQRIDGKLVERAVKYVADFTYEQRNKDGTWEKVVEDAKGCRTEVYRIKKKLMLYVHGIRIVEV